MKSLALLVLFLLTLNQKEIADKYLSPIDAEKILGQKAKLLSNTTEKRDTVIRYSSVYITNVDQKVSNLNYLLEEYKNKSAAETTYNFIVAQNQGLSGQNRIKDIGDEAFWHSDDQNFCLMMVRKGNKIIRIKVNKITKVTSKEDIKIISKRIALTL
jgi:hypothetical protein